MGETRACSDCGIHLPLGPSQQLRLPKHLDTLFHLSASIIQALTIGSETASHSCQSKRRLSPLSLGHRGLQLSFRPRLCGSAGRRGAVRARWPTRAAPINPKHTRFLACCCLRPVPFCPRPTTDPLDCATPPNFASYPSLSTLRDQTELTCSAPHVQLPTTQRVPQEQDVKTCAHHSPRPPALLAIPLASYSTAATRKTAAAGPPPRHFRPPTTIAAAPAAPRGARPELRGPTPPGRDTRAPRPAPRRRRCGRSRSCSCCAPTTTSSAGTHKATSSAAEARMAD